MNQAPLPFYCPTCEARESSARDCKCGDGPLLDLRTEFARELLEGIDDKRRQRNEVTRRWLAVVPTFITMVVIWSVVPFMEYLALPFHVEKLFLAGAIGLAYMGLFDKILPFHSLQGPLSEVHAETAGLSPADSAC